MEIYIEGPVDIDQAVQSTPPAIYGALPSWWPVNPECRLSYIRPDGTEVFYQEVTYSPGMPNPEDVGTPLNCPPRSGLTPEQQQRQRQRIEAAYQAQYMSWRSNASR